MSERSGLPSAPGSAHGSAPAGGAGSAPTGAADDLWDRRLPLYAYLEPLWAGRKVLEIGCGTGASADYLAAHGATRVVAIDSDPSLIERARARRRRPGLEFRTLPHLTDLTKLAEAFDVVLAPDADLLARRADVIAAWKTGDATKIEPLLLETTRKYPEVYKKFLTDRNRVWFPKIEELLTRDKNVFVVVGMAHLVGKDSVVDLLKTKGFRVEQL